MTMLEEMLDDNDIRLWAARKKNSKHPHSPSWTRGDSLIPELDDIGRILERGLH